MKDCNLWICVLIVLFISFVLNYFILKNANYLDKVFDTRNKKHAIHEYPVPRIGGLAIFLALFFGILCLGNSYIFFIYLLSTSIFLVGLVEDLIKDISPKIRLSLIFVLSLIVVFSLDLRVSDLGFFILPDYVVPFFTAFAIAGFTSALNIVDGLNGLASGIAIIFLLFLGLTFWEQGILHLTYFCFLIISAILGFFIFNFPFGKIFLGDGGAYFLGFICAVLSVKLLNSNPNISPWFPFLLGAYPVVEVLFSAFRRKIKGKHPFSPDKLHFHTLVYYRVTRSNPKASALILGFIFIFSLLAFLLKECTACLMVEFFVFCMLYWYIYRTLTASARLGRR